MPSGLPLTVTSTGREADLPGPVDRGDLACHHCRCGPGLLLCSPMEDDKNCSPWVEVQRDGGSTIRDGVGGWRDFAGIRVPEAGRHAGDAEAGFCRSGVVAAIVDEANIAVSELAMDELEVCAVQRFDIAEVRRDVHFSKRLGNSLAGVYGGFADVVNASAVTEELICKRMEFGLAVCKTRFAAGFWKRVFVRMMWWPGGDCPRHIERWGTIRAGCTRWRFSKICVMAHIPNC